MDVNRYVSQEILDAMEQAKSNLSQWFEDCFNLAALELWYHAIGADGLFLLLTTKDKTHARGYSLQWNSRAGTLTLMASGKVPVRTIHYLEHTDESYQH